VVEEGGEELVLPAGQLTKDEVFIVFDTETTGLHPDKGDKIVEIAAVPIINGTIREDCLFHTLVNPGFEIPKEASKIHGITNVDVAGAPDDVTVIREFHRYVGVHDLVAQNAVFDMGFIEPVRMALGLAPFFGTVHCTLIMARETWPDERRNRLQDICKRLGIDVRMQHRAIDDVLLTAKVFTKLREVGP